MSLTSTSTMDSKDANWEIMVDLAKLLHQEYFELLPEWTIYHEKDYKCLKQNIGFALFGPPSEHDSDITKNEAESVAVVTYNENQLINTFDITDALKYSWEAQSIINDIFEKICELGKGVPKSGNGICFGIIYNIILRNKYTSVSKCRKDKSEGREKFGDKINVIPTPVFKIRTSLCETLYIDKNGRVYKNWSDYKENNTLPKCTMVLPVEGVYQANPVCLYSEEHSVVWIHTLDSPACSIAATVQNTVDVTSNLVGTVGLGVGLASLLIPVGPVLLGASLLANTANGLWTIGRCTQRLIDRASHGEGISPIADKDTFCTWLGITGGAAGLAASGGTYLLSNAVKRGSYVGSAAKHIYNSVLVVNIGVNGVGITNQMYCMYDKYKTDKAIDPIDVLLLGTHLLFFGSAVINTQFAGELISSTQGKVLDEYKASLRSKRLRKAFNRVRRNAAAGHRDVRDANADVIRYINNKKDLMSQLSQSQRNNSSSANSLAHNAIHNGAVITIKNVLLIDPLSHAMKVRHSDNSESENINYRSTSECSDANGNLLENLKELLKNLLYQFYQSYGCTRAGNLPTVSDFEDILQEMRFVKSAEDILRKMVNISATLIKQCDSLDKFFVTTIRFIWSYLKANIKKYSRNLGVSFNDCRMHNLLFVIVTIILEEIEILDDKIIEGVLMYVSQH